MVAGVVCRCWFNSFSVEVNQWLPTELTHDAHMLVCRHNF